MRSFLNRGGFTALDPGDRLTSHSSQALFVASGITLVAGLGVVPSYLGWLNHDVGWFLYLAEELVRGADLYREYLEVNPPLAIWVHLPPVLLATVINVGPHQLFPVYVTLLAIGSLELCAIMLRSTFPTDSLFPSVSLIVIALVFFMLPGYDFGQREHLTLLLITPYLLASAFRPPGWDTGPRWTTYLVALLGGIGFMMKPYFLLAWIAVELVALRRYSVSTLVGRHRNRVVVGLLFAYGAAVLLLEPDYLALVGELSGVYTAFPVRPWYAEVIHETTLTTAAVLVVALTTCRLTGCVGDRAVLVGGASAFAFLLAAIIQNASWGYHFLPARGVTVLFVFYCSYRVLSDRRDGLAWTGSLATRVAGYALLFCAGALAIQLASATGIAVKRIAGIANPPGHQLKEAVARWTEPGDRFAVLSTYLSTSFPLVNESDLEWVLSEPSLWWVVAVYSTADPSGTKIEHRAPPEMGRSERAFYLGVIDRLATRSPSVLAIATPEANGEDFTPGYSLDIVSYFRQDSVFDSLMKRYRQIGVIDGFGLYLRESASDSS